MSDEAIHTEHVPLITINMMVSLGSRSSHVFTWKVVLWLNVHLVGDLNAKFPIQSKGVNKFSEYKLVVNCYTYLCFLI